MKNNFSKTEQKEFCIHVISDKPCFINGELTLFNEQGYLIKNHSSNFEVISTPDFPDLFIVDIANPQIDQFKLIEKIRNASSQVGVLATISLLNQDDRVKAFLSGADNYIIRPYEVEELLAIVGSLKRRLRPAADSAHCVAP